MHFWFIREQQTAQGGSPRIREIDMAKAIGVICMLIGHRTVGPIHDYVYLFHMPLFFILSGCTMKEEKLSVGQILRRENKLLSSYIVFSVIVIVQQFCLEPNRNVLVQNIVDTFSFFGIGALWFLSSLWIAKTVHETDPQQSTRKFGAFDGFCYL